MLIQLPNGDWVNPAFVVVVRALHATSPAPGSVIAPPRVPDRVEVWLRDCGRIDCIVPHCKDRDEAEQVRNQLAKQVLEVWE